MTNDERCFWITQGWDAFVRGFGLGKGVYIPAGEQRRTWIEGYNAAEHHAHLTPESLATSQAVSNASALEQSDGDTPPAQAQVA